MMARAVPAPSKSAKPRKKGWIILLALAALLLLAVLIALWVAQSRYEAVFRAPRVQHEIFATGNTTLKIVVKPPLAQRRIATLLLPERNLPDWLLNMTVPEETAILFDTDLEQSLLKLRVFVNYARLGPVIRDALNQSGIAASTPGIQWAPPEVVQKQPGVLLLEGSAPIAQQTVMGVQAQWTDGQSFPPPSIEGTHVFELALENRNGKGYATLAALAELNGSLDPSIATIFNPKSLFLVAAVNAYADFVGEDTLAVDILIEGNPSAGENVATQLQFYLDAFKGLVSGELRRKYGAELEGKSTIEGSNVRGLYTIKGIDALLGKGQATE